MVIQTANLVHQIAPAGAVTTKARRMFALKLHNADGGIESQTRLFAATDLFWRYEAGGADVYRVGDDLAFIEPSGRVTGRRYVKQMGWHDSTKAVRAAFASGSSAQRPHRIREFGSNLFTIHERIEWIEVANSHYSFLTLGAAGAVAVNGKPMHVGELPIVLGTAWIVARPGDGQVLLADVDGALDRYRNVTGKWQRLVKRRRVPWSELGPGMFGRDSGELVFTAHNIPSLTIPAGKAFTMHLHGGQSLVRVCDNGPIYCLSDTRADVVEYATEGRTLWRQEGARDNWSHELLGVPGHDGEKAVLSKEVTPGVIVYANGKVEVLNRGYLLGEPINLQCGAVSIRRAAGAFEPMYISANGAVVAYPYAPSGDWFKMIPVSPDQKAFTWRRCVGQQNPIDVWVAHADIVIGKTPGLRLAGLMTAAVWRFVKAADNEPCLAPFSFVIVVLYMMVQVARAVLLLAALPLNTLWRICRRVRRSIELSK